MIRKVAVKDKNGVIRVDEIGGTRKLQVPWQNGSLVYNGTAQSPVWAGYDPEKMWTGNMQSATDAGTYETLFRPKEGYTWADGTTEAKTVTWTIKKAAMSGVPIATAESTGTAGVYNVSVPGVQELRKGMLLAVIPDMTGVYQINPKLNVNGLGEKLISRWAFRTPGDGRVGISGSEFREGQAYLLQYIEDAWIIFGFGKPHADDLYGTIPSGHLPVVPESKGGTGQSDLTGTDYSAYRVRKAAIVSSVPTSMSNGTLAFVYS